MKRLQLKFKTADGHNKNLVLDYVKTDLDPATVKSAMEKISASKLFEKSTVQLYQEVSSAKYVERIESQVFEALSTTDKNY
ncbi:hypothetical protein COSHB9_00480 [Companilactobacillus alimentarius]|uniref:DUF2922 domain-containing protein n=1 Tax=Companilactobacillus alimentarius DSM 20249 TaxID=1423720 RepID=A0A2K9HJ02_9LACO|nr:DUF2922 domain-containing protein [Companilactobacillus alimentarius]AUI72509.1 hypothetical protein LA20249_10085 [Companilactobacillus alimentarius DSM 20249]KRK77722.1 hypothetical protein FC67_GL000058 [Companilactobacillus alimentarius DSM 20249]MDT6953102.1 DUF2922 domain-containing protein [Companilactobacillus alimentarius]GEO45042.1 hypothetical protein LAL01_12740 [Companilactobacillus alimentarius]